MTKEDIIRKLTSRKFWAAVVEFITAVLLAFHFDENIIAQVASIIMAGGALIAFILAEGWVDAKRAGAQSNDQQSEP